MLKLYINESAYIKEDIEAVKKYYPNIEDNMFMNLIALDPTYRDGSNSVGKYGKWILNLYNKGNLSEDDFNNITDVLNQFTTYRNRIQNKDLNSYKSLSALEDVLASVVDDDSMLTDRQKVRFLKNVRAGRVKTSAEDDYDIVLETPNFVVYVPNTHEASMKLGKDTQWCTAHENPEWYNYYTEDNGKLYIVKNKKTDERWQYSDLKGDFLDQHDVGFNVLKLLIQDKQLAKFFNQFGFAVPDNMKFTDDGYYLVYTGDDIPDVYKHHIHKIKILGDVEHIKENSFKNNDNLTDVIISHGVISIGSEAFSNCYELSSVKISNSISTIGPSAFSSCGHLSNLILPNDLQYLGKFAFCSCKSLTSVTIPKSVISMGDYAFSSCSSLESVVIPGTVTTISKGAFSSCSSLTSLIISNGVSEIKSEAFMYCQSLQSVAIPDSVTILGGGAFKSCYDLHSIKLSNNLTVIEEETFENCSNLKNIIIPDSVTTIEMDAFLGCENLQSISIPNSVTTIDELAFWGCTNLESIIIPNSVTKLGVQVFKRCPNLIVYTNNKYVINYCNENDIPTQPLNSNESYRKPYKLHIKEGNYI